MGTYILRKGVGDRPVVVDESRVKLPFQLLKLVGNLQPKAYDLIMLKLQHQLEQNGKYYQ